MKWLCKILGHRWDGCCCARCAARRDEGHDWDGCQCKRCARTRNQDHDWDGCKCRKCDMTRNEGHDWDGCICKRCKEWRDQEHEVVNEVCKKCRENVSSDTCTSCKKPFALTKRKRGTQIAICEYCYHRAESVGGHRLISYNAPGQWDTEVMCVRCGKTMNYYDSGGSFGVDFKKTPCR